MILALSKEAWSQDDYFNAFPLKALGDADDTLQARMELHLTYIICE